jgi:hypothetical protein
MNIYFKYTAGESFTLNSEDYVGYFHVIDGIAYTGRGNDVNSSTLTPKQTFLTEFYLKELDFSYDSDNLPILEYIPISRMDIMDESKLLEVLEVLNYNNLQIYSYLFRPSIQNLAMTPTNTYFYGVSSSPVDSRNDDIPTGKNTYTHIDPLSYYPPLDFLDDCRPLNLLVNEDETFYYTCASDTTQYSLTGSFVDKEEPLTLVDQEDDIVLIDSFFDTEFNYLILRDIDKISIYDYTDFHICQTKFLIDSFDMDPQIQLSFGNRYRGEILGDILTVKQKYTNVITHQYNLSKYNIGEVVAMDVRASDDAIIIVDDSGQFIYSNLDTFEEELTIQTIDDIVPASIEYIQFYTLDSNIFTIRFDDDIRYRYIKDVDVYIPVPVRNKTLYYLDDYIYNDVFEKHNKIPIKHNSNNMLSNTYTNNGIIEVPRGEHIYRITHNIGRIYMTSDELIAAVGIASDSVYKKYLSKISCEKSSIGFSINMEVKKVMDDVLTLYKTCAAIPQYSEDGFSLKVVPEFDVDLLNTKLHENEGINVSTLERIFYSIFSLQKQFFD